jgi:hypothetical protein
MPGMITASPCRSSVSPSPQPITTVPNFQVERFHSLSVERDADVARMQRGRIEKHGSGQFADGQGVSRSAHVTTYLP